MMAICIRVSLLVYKGVYVPVSQKDGVFVFAPAFKGQYRARYVRP